MKKGFTLIELLIAISIIGLLTAVGFTTFPSILRLARDTGRRSDLKQVQNALESYGNITGGLYPSRIAVADSNTTTLLCADLNLKLEPDIVCTQDSFFATDSTYGYRYTTNGTGSGNVDATIYLMWGKLESKTPTSYWVICSNGKTGITTTIPTTYTCPTLQ